MFPTRHRWVSMPWKFTSPQVTDAVRDAAAVTAVSRKALNPRMAFCHPARTFTCGGRIVDIRRRLAIMVGTACVLAGSMAMAAGNGSPAQDLVKQVTSSIIEELESGRESLQDSPERAYELAAQLVLPHFDFERMSRHVLGNKRWKAATPEQRLRFVSAFRTRLVRTYAMVLNEYRGQTLTYLDPVPRKKDDEIVVPVEIELTGSQTVRVAYAMHVSGSDWKVFDVAVDGISLVTSYRSSFRSEIARHGIDGLIARLETKNAATH